MRRLTVILSWIVLLALPARSQAAPSPANVNLRAGDLPHGFHLYSSVTVTGKRLAQSGGSHAFRLSLHDLALAQLTAFVDAAAHGITFIESDTLLYTSAEAAHADYAFAAAAPVIPPLQRLAIAHLGVEGLGRTQVVTQGKSHERLDDIVFRRGPYIYLLRAAGTNGTFSPAQAVALARVVDARIQHSH
jgi:hypothetical protein